jgi:peptide/nickel transport system substrate-binding protein
VKKEDERMKHKWAGMALLLAASLVFFACGGKEEVVEEKEEAQFEGTVPIDRDSWEKGNPGGRFVRAALGDPKTFNPVVASETSTTEITELLFDTIARRDTLTLDWAPKLAESWEISEDQKSVTVTLRDNIKWTDGEQLTADDVVYTVNELIFAEVIQSNMRDGLFVGDEPSVWTKVDELTFKVELPTVYAGIINMLDINVMPKHVFKPLVDEQGPEAVNSFWGVDVDPEEIVSSGPFMLAEYEASQRVVMRKNPNYYREDQWGQQLPYLDEVVYTIVEDQDTMFAKYLAGETDFHPLRGEEFSEMNEKKEELNTTIYDVGPDAGTTFITFNMNPVEGEDDNGITAPELTWLSNRKFRTAMAHLIDRETMINNVAYGFGYPQYSFVPRFSPYYWEDVDEEAPKYDPERAKELLEEIGYKDRDGNGVREDPDGNEINLVLNTNSGNRVRESIGEIFSQEAKNAGIDVTFKPEEFNSLVGKLLSSYDWEMILIGLTGSVDPISGANVYPSSGNLHMIEPNQEEPRRDWEKAVDEAWKKANQTTDEEQRKEGFVEIQKIWVEQVPWVYTYNPALIYAFKNKYGNIKCQPVDDYDWMGIMDRIYIKE